MTPLAFLVLLPGEIGVLESKAFSPQMQVASVTATVRLVNSTRGDEGSGVVLERSGPFVYVLTAGHLVRRGDSVEISTFSAKSHPRPEATYRSGVVLASSESPDLAVVRIASTDTFPGTARLCPPAQVPEGTEIPALTVGCGGGRAPGCQLEALTGKRKVKKPGGREPGLYWEARQAPVKGRSGGPLLDRRGHVIGLASGAGDGKGYYTHVDEIRTFLGQNGLKWLAK